MAIAAPFLSLFDSGASAEGSIDPLSLASTYDNLANRLLPHLTVRMQRPRFVTAIAVGALVCDSLHDEISADGRTPSWLVFEWHIIEALMRGQQDQQGNDIWGIPGSQKVTRALRFGRRLGADAYLKTPTVFGFTGVYLRLARGLQVVDDGMRLDEAGYVLLKEWEQEQGLEGFRTGTTGLGAELRNACTTAVADAMAKGHTCRSPSWEHWRALFTHLRPDTPGPKECALLAERLLHPQTDAETAAVSEEFLRAIGNQGKAITRQQEAGLFRRLIPKASPELSRRLDLVDAYEAVTRPLTDAFALLRYLSTQAGCTPIRDGEFAKASLAQRIVQQLPPALDRVEELFVGDPLWQDMALLISRYRHLTTPNQLFEELVRHHEDSQRAKPPEGKRPWIERLNGVAVRPQYAQDDEPEGGDTYVHEYRTPSACQFLQDLGRLPR